MEKTQENNRYKALQSKIMVFGILLAIVILQSFNVSSYYSNVFTNNNITENLTFIGVQNITRNLSIPQNTFLIDGYFNLSYASATLNLSQNLTAYWKFDSTEANGFATDSSGKGHHLQNYSVTYIAGKFGTAAVFDGTNSWFNGSDSADWDFGTGDFTIAYWINTTDSVNGGGVISSVDSWIGNGMWDVQADSAGKTEFQWNGDGTAGNRTFNDGKWHRVVIVNRGGTIYIYLDGLQDQVKANGMTYNNGETLRVGRTAAASAYFEGYIDELIVSNGYAWSVANVTADYNSGNGREISDSPNSAFNVTLNDFEIFSGITTNSSTFDTRTKSSNLRTYINNYISSCTFVGGYCLVPFIFKSAGDMILQYSNLYFNNHGFIENSQSYNSTSYETQTEGFILNMSYDSNAYTATADLIYDGTAYTGTKIQLTNQAIFSKTLNLGTSDIGVNPFYWNITLTNSSNSYNFTSANYTQTVSTIQLGLCNATLTIPFLNFTFVDEVNNTALNATIDTMSLIYYISGASSSGNKSFTFNPGYSSFNYQFCFLPGDKTIVATGTVQYSTNGYPQRRYSLADTTLTNLTTLKQLVLLSSGYGLYSKYIAVDSLSNEAITGVSAIAQRTVNGSTTIVESGLTDSAGLVTFWLNPDYDHTFTFSKSGYSTNTFTLRPTSSDPVYVPMVASTGLGGTNYTVGINITNGLVYHILPENTTLINNTQYTFAFNVTNSEVVYSLISMNLTNKSGYQLYYGSNAGAGYISTLLNTNNNTQIIGYFKLVAGDQTNTFVKIWDIGNYYEGTYSLLAWLRSYDSNGFGVTGDWIKWLIMVAVTIGLAYGFSTYGSNYIESMDTSYGSIIAVILGTAIFWYINWLPTLYSLGIFIVVSLTGIGLILWRTFASR